MIHLGPILGFRGGDAQRWNVSVLLVVAQSDHPPVTCPAATVTGPVVLKTFAGRKAIRFDFSIPVEDREQRVNYQAGGHRYDFFVSGDVHVAANGRVTSTLPEHRTGSYVARMNQLISSAIVHPPPSLSQAFFIDHIISGDPPELEAGMNAELLNLPGTGSRLRAKRNWLDLALDEGPTPRLWANWWFEGEDNAPATRVIHPPGIGDSGGV